jgi:hypothetical protein
MSNSSSTSLISCVVQANFTAGNGAAPISIPGLLAGDIVVNGSVNGMAVWGSFAPYFEPVVSVNGQLQQLGGNLSGPAFVLYLLRPVL